MKSTHETLRGSYDYSTYQLPQTLHDGEARYSKIVFTPSVKRANLAFVLRKIADDLDRQQDGES